MFAAPTNIFCVNWTLHGKAIDLLQGGGGEGGEDTVLYFQLSLHPDFTTQQSPIYCPMSGPDSCFQADIGCGKHTLPKALSHVCVCVSESSGFTVWPLLL